MTHYKMKLGRSWRYAGCRASGQETTSHRSLVISSRANEVVFTGCVTNQEPWIRKEKNITASVQSKDQTRLGHGGHGGQVMDTPALPEMAPQEPLGDGHSKLTQLGGAILRAGGCARDVSVRDPRQQRILESRTKALAGVGGDGLKGHRRGKHGKL
ncbi:hypothetical protein BV22DRAFT_1052392 [Leucogyrophana mollusca]|uniref:Uncharacterized protein n=1 Tax=Leucogyrophana mollusca TaxID=85980 RepID=A0ACB8AW60_9AGAM|nr:hypothetical protein BV22DRAFT_1052392 [Leucogyrophana mollusca]